MDSLISEHDKLIKKQKQCVDQSRERLDALIASLQDARAALLRPVQQPPVLDPMDESEPGMPPSAPVAATASATITYPFRYNPKDVLDRAKKTHEIVTELHRDLYNATSKYTKAVDKRFKLDIDTIWDSNAFDGKDALLHRAIAIHLVREGRFELADIFLKEADVLGEDISSSIRNDLESLRHQFTAMHQILAEMRTGSLEGAIRWAHERREHLEKRGSILEFQLVKLQFLKFVTVGMATEALEYAKKEFGYFKKNNMKDIQRLMGSLMFIRRLPTSPYKDLISPTLWSDAQHSFSRDFCLHLGLSSDSPLHVAITVGTSALPTIAKMSGILKDRAGLEWTTADELPVEIPLQEKERFHSVFACPVSKDLGTDDNPPMMMQCGHVICKESLSRLSKGNATAGFKCPYCPAQNTAQQAVRVYF
ncbi:CTLH/CRA C-terminal to lish motif domain-containing protein [Zopfochytrium polystomum]|nr:CTLH/CRA C-terminal to lish motif domain-containing protein [Zopfochytrium polystomum]